MEKLQKLEQIIAENTQVQHVRPETVLSDLGIDSLEFVYLMHEIERAFECRIEDSQYAILNTVADILTVLPDVREILIDEVSSWRLGQTRKDCARGMT